MVIRQQRRTQLQHTHRYSWFPCTSSPAQLARGDGTYDQVVLTGYGAPSMALTGRCTQWTLTDLTEYRGHLTDADMLRLDAVLRRALGV